MKNILRVAAVLAGLVAVIPQAHAGWGATAFLTSESDLGANVIGAPAWAPTVDYRRNGLLFQIPALNLIGGMASKNLDLGLGFSGTMLKGAMSGTTDGVLALGVNGRYFTPTGGAKDSSGISLILKARMGAEVKKGMGFGIYVVPQLGISNFADGKPATAARDIGLGWGGGLEISTWFAGK